MRTRPHLPFLNPPHFFICLSSLISHTADSIQGMVDMMTCMERVANTPIPRSYSIHLKQCVTLYLFSLPFTLVKDLGWGMVPLVTVVAFTLMGIEGIADEIEMPFGTDASDLPLGKLYHCADDYS